MIRKIYNKIYRVYQNLGIEKIVKVRLINPTEKIVSEFDNFLIVPIYNMLNRYLFSRINYHYGAGYRIGNFKSQNLDFETNNLGYGSIHYSLIRNAHPRRVLCVGSMYGFIPFMCALGCRDNRNGVVDFVDAGYDINNPDDKGRHNWGQGFWKKVVAKNHFSFMKTEKYINTYIMTTKDYAKKFSKRTYDYIYIDGDHRYDGVTTDYELFWPKLKKGGFMAFHDTDNYGIHGDIYYDVTKFCRKFIYPKNKYFHFQNKESGLVIVQK